MSRAVLGTGLGTAEEIAQAMPGLPTTFPVLREKRCVCLQRACCCPAVSAAPSRPLLRKGLNLPCRAACYSCRDCFEEGALNGFNIHRSSVVEIDTPHAIGGLSRLILLRCRLALCARISGGLGKLCSVLEVSHLKFTSASTSLFTK